MFARGGPTLRELTVQALSSTRRGYDLVADRFDLTPFRTPDLILEPVGRALSKTGRWGDAIDLCCGTGAGVSMLAKISDRVVGVDYSEGMLRVAAKRVGADATLVRGNVFDLPFDSASFDLATCFGAFGHIEEHRQPAFLHEVRRILRPGGCFAFVTTEMPRPLSRRWAIYRGFNAVMRARNAVLSPPFIMYYLNFTVPKILPMFEREGFATEVAPLGGGAPGFAKLVVATRR